MNSASTADSRNLKRRWPRFTLRQIAVLFAIVAVCLATMVHFAPHAKFLIDERGLSGHLSPIRAVDVREMPDAPTPADWTNVDIDGLRFSLPPGLAKSKALSVDVPSNTEFSKDSMLILVIKPSNDHESLEWARAVSQTLSFGGRAAPSIVDLKQQVYESSSDDFRWTMSHSELRKHQWRMAMSRLLNVKPPDVDHVETLRSDSIQALLLVRGPTAELEWHSLQEEKSGVIIFGPENRNSLDLKLIRAICRNLEYQHGADE